MQSKDYGQYFIPKAAHSAETLTAAAAVHNGMICVKKCVVTKIMFVITTLTATDTVAPKVEFNHRPTIGSATGETALGVLTIPDGSAVGKVIYKEIDPVAFEPGEELSFEHTVQGTDGSSAAGAGYYAVEFDDSPEYDGNLSNMVASA
jgi:hypothetical protein